MVDRNFWRRAAAYVIDLVIFAFLAAMIALVLSSVFSSRFLAPSLIRSTNCELREDLYSAERMQELLPLDFGGVHQQIVCRQTNMFATSFHATTLRKIWEDNGVRYVVSIGYYSDANGTPETYIDLDPIFYILSPFVFALFLMRWGATPGKKLLRVVVYNDALERPTLLAALKREYLKGILVVLPSILGLYTIYDTLTFDLDRAARNAELISGLLSTLGFLGGMVVGIVLFIAAFWFLFGSFIRWRGRTYWDRFAKLTTSREEELLWAKGTQD